MTVATYLAYQPDCFGSNDVTLTGWEDIPVGYGSPEMGSILEPTWFEEPTAAMLMDFVPGTCEPCEPNLMVHVNPASTLHFESDGVYVVITGHRQDPAANTCHTIFEDAPAAPAEQPGESKSSCVDKFVLTSVRAAPPPSGALDFCPSVSTLDVDSFLHTDPVCFHGKTLKIAGWADALPPIDYDGPSIDPHWLSYPTLPFTALWSVKPFVFDGSRGCPDASVGSVGTCFWMTPEVKPNTGVSFTPSQGWVILTGHIDDPVAETCHYTSTGLGEAAILPAVYARQTCRSSFVITKVESATAPAS